MCLRRGTTPSLIEDHEGLTARHTHPQSIPTPTIPGFEQRMPDAGCRSCATRRCPAARSSLKFNPMMATGVRAANRTSKGCSSRHAAHHEAHTFNIQTWPDASARRTAGLGITVQAGRSEDTGAGRSISGRRRLFRDTSLRPVSQKAPTRPASNARGNKKRILRRCSLRDGRFVFAGLCGTCGRLPATEPPAAIDMPTEPDPVDKGFDVTRGMIHAPESNCSPRKTRRGLA